jgi:hypothetical protein
LLFVAVDLKEEEEIIQDYELFINICLLLSAAPATEPTGPEPIEIDSVELELHTTSADGIISLAN